MKSTLFKRIVDSFSYPIIIKDHKDIWKIYGCWSNLAVLQHIRGMQISLYNYTPWTVWAPGCACYRVRVKKLLSKLLLFIKKEVGNTFKLQKKTRHIRQSWILGQLHWRETQFIWLFRQYFSFHPLLPLTMWQKWVTLELALQQNYVQFKENPSIA